MSSAEGGALPPQCRLVPVLPADSAAPVRLCAVVQLATVGAATAPTLILLGSSWLGRAYLGALADARDGVQAWLEIWVQHGAEPTSLDESEAGTNREADARWARWAEALRHDSALLATGWETKPAPPVWLDPANGKAVIPRDAASGETYALCTDDAALLVAGLDSFSESRRRFLAVKNSPGAGFLAPTGDVPSGARAAGDALPNGGKGLVPFNPEGGCLLVRRLAPLEWEQHAGLLSGKAFRGLAAGRPPVKLGGPYASLDDWERLQQSGAHLFASSRGRAGRFHETFHLKLLLLQSMVREVRAQVSATQLPRLNLVPGSFRVELSAASGALPVLWTARAVLSDPPGSIALTAPGDLRYFKPVAGFSSSVYRPEGAGRAVRGRGELRIRKVLPSGDRTQVEATIVSPEVAGASPRDLVWARLPLPGAGTLNLVGNIDAAEALTGGEARFRTAPIALAGAALLGLKQAEGGVFPGTPFETIPLLSTPVDLYALGVLAVQLFLTGGGKPLGTAVDETLSFARAAAALTGEAKYAEKIRQLAASDARWPESLGPHHHGHGATPDEAASLMPVELWWDTVAALGRFFAGSSPQAFARDFGDAPSFQLDAPLVAAGAEVDNLVLRSQSLLLCDWPSNREVARVIQKVR